MFAPMLKLKILSEESLKRRAFWVEEIVKISGRFGEDSSRVISELTTEIKREGVAALVDHLRLCGSIPEHYGHDSSEEKLYSKYTDAVLAAAYRHIGLTSTVIEERADAADVEAVGRNLSLVADAKAFRLSRTAKNQKDFKIEALDGWKRGKPHAMVVCPIYQLPARTSQIYQQALARNVCIFSYSHLAVILQLHSALGEKTAVSLLSEVFTCAEVLQPTKDSVAYWTCINRAMLHFRKEISPIWLKEKIAMVESLEVAKADALAFLAKQREEIMRLDRDEAIRRLIADKKLEGRGKKIQSITDNGILSMG
jgi:hypothetical protein